MTISLASADVRLLKRAMMQMVSPYTASSETRWLLGVTDILKKLLHADKGSARVMKGERMGILSEDIDPGCVTAYSEYYHQFDAGRALAGQISRLPRVWTVEDSYRDRLDDFYKTEYFNDCLVRWKILHSLCVSNKSNPGPLDGVMYFHRERRDSPEFDARAKMILRIFSPALRAGMTQGFAAARPEALVATVDQLSDGCALVTLSGLMLHQNPALCRLIQSDRQQGNLPGAIAGAVAGIASLGSTNGADALSNDPAPECVLIDNVSYALSACCLGQFAGIAEPVILVTVALTEGGNDSGRTRVVDPRFGLSAREQEVAMLLAGRKTNREIAARLGISEHTVRHHTERVLKKLGVDRKSAVAEEICNAHAEPSEGRGLSPWPKALGCRAGNRPRAVE